MSKVLFTRLKRLNIEHAIPDTHNNHGKIQNELPIW